jgi:hypothetical protein
MGRILIHCGRARYKTPADLIWKAGRTDAIFASYKPLQHMLPITDKTERAASQQTRISVDMIDTIGLDTVLNNSRKLLSEQGFTLGLYYMTFRHDGFRKNIVTLCCFSSNYLMHKQCLSVVAPDEDIDDAISWVKSHNHHLEFYDEPIKGHNGDDFICNHLTAVLNFKLKP